MKLFISLCVITTFTSHSDSWAAPPPEIPRLTTHTGEPLQWAVFPVSIGLQFEHEEELLAYTRTPHQWSQVENTNVSIHPQYLKTSPVESQDALNRIAFVPETLWQANYGFIESVAAHTEIHYQTDGTILEADIVLNKTFNFTTLANAAGLDLQSILVHEMGHFLGMAHLDCDLASSSDANSNETNTHPTCISSGSFASSVMQDNIEPGESAGRKLTSTDTLWLQEVYASGQPKTVPLISEYLKPYFVTLEHTRLDIEFETLESLQSVMCVSNSCAGEYIPFTVSSADLSEGNDLLNENAAENKTAPWVVHLDLTRYQFPLGLHHLIFLQENGKPVLAENIIDAGTVETEVIHQRSSGCNIAAIRTQGPFKAWLFLMLLILPFQGSILKEHL